MADNVRKLCIVAALSAVLLLSVVVLAVSYPDIGITDEPVNISLSLAAGDISAVPESVAENAARLAGEMFGNSRARYQAFLDQLLATYVNAEGKDFVVFFNPGGWGWSTADQSAGWRSILDGIGLELSEMGYRSVVVNYRRTSDTFLGGVKEFIEATTRYPSKAEDLAQRVDFLTANIPDIRVIVAGESNGTLISDRVMNILQDNQQVFSIQTGTPFWHKQVTYGRTLVIRDNGLTPDTFSEGDIPAMIWATLRGWLGLLPPENEPGNVMRFLRAPGHEYSWQYPRVYTEIVDFLTSNFGTQKEL